MSNKTKNATISFNATENNFFLIIYEAPHIYEIRGLTVKHEWIIIVNGLILHLSVIIVMEVGGCYEN